MPNWSFNHMIVSGSENDLADFVTKANGENGKLDFNSFIPQPDNLFKGDLGQKDEDNCKKLGIPNWYNWNVDNWDTKWNACHIEFSWDGKDVVFHFDTAWSPPANVFAAMSAQHPELSFEIECEIEGSEYGLSYRTDKYGDLMEYAHPFIYQCCDTDEIVTWSEEDNKMKYADGRKCDDWWGKVDFEISLEEGGICEQR